MKKKKLLYNGKSWYWVDAEVYWKKYFQIIHAIFKQAKKDLKL